MSHDHTHGPAAGENAAALSPDSGHLHAEVRRPLLQEMRRVRWAILITGAVMVVEVIGGIATNSLALLSDAGHMLTHLLALGMSYFAIVLAARPATQQKTFGYYRAEVLAAFINSLALLAIAAFIFYTAVRRIMAPREIKSGYMLIVAVLGLAANGSSVALLVRLSRQDINIRAAFLHVLYDTISSVAVVATALIIKLSGAVVLDPVVSLGIGVLILIWAFRLLSESAHILLESTPEHLDIGHIRAEMEALPHVHHVHDVHLWQITTNMYVLTAHVVVERVQISDTVRIIDEANALLREHYGIGHATLQIEYGLPEQEHHGTSPREVDDDSIQEGA